MAVSAGRALPPRGGAQIPARKDPTPRMETPAPRMEIPHSDFPGTRGNHFPSGEGRDHSSGLHTTLSTPGPSTLSPDLLVLGRANSVAVRTWS